MIFALKQEVAELFPKFYFVFSIATKKALLGPTFRVGEEIIAVGLSKRYSSQAKAVVHSLVVHKVFGAQLVDPYRCVAVMISTELLRVAIFTLQKSDHADIVCLGQVALRKASSLLDFAALFLILL